MHARELKIDERGTSVKSYEDVRLFVQVVVADPSLMQRAYQLVQEVEEIFGQFRREWEGDTFDPLTQKNVLPARDAAPEQGRL